MCSTSNSYAENDAPARQCYSACKQCRDSGGIQSAIRYSVRIHSAVVERLDATAHQPQLQAPVPPFPRTKPHPSLDSPWLVLARCMPADFRRLRAQPSLGERKPPHVTDASHRPSCRIQPARAVSLEKKQRSASISPACFRAAKTCLFCIPTTTLGPHCNASTVRRRYFFCVFVFFTRIVYFFSPSHPTISPLGHSPRTTSRYPSFDRRNAGHSSFLQPCTQAMPAGGSSCCRYLVALCECYSASNALPIGRGIVSELTTNLSTYRPSATTPTPVTGSQNTTVSKTPKCVFPSGPSIEILLSWGCA